MKYSELPKEIKLQDDVDTLLEVNEELRKIIDKAIEYIKEKSNYNYNIALVENALIGKDIDELLKILGGENNE